MNILSPPRESVVQQDDRNGLRLSESREGLVRATPHGRTDREVGRLAAYLKNLNVVDLSVYDKTVPHSRESLIPK